MESGPQRIVNHAPTGSDAVKEVLAVLWWPRTVVRCYTVVSACLPTGR